MANTLRISWTTLRRLLQDIYSKGNYEIISVLCAAHNFPQWCIGPFMLTIKFPHDNTIWLIGQVDLHPESDNIDFLSFLHSREHTSAGFQRAPWAYVLDWISMSVPEHMAREECTVNFNTPDVADHSWDNYNSWIRRLLACPNYIPDPSWR